MVKVLLADDQALVRSALAALLGLEPDIEVVAEVGRGDDVVAAARASGAQVCLVDVQMPGQDGLETVAEVRRELPDVRCLVVTTFNRPGYLRQAMDAGASGFVVKDAPASELVEAVRRVALGLRVVDPEAARRLLMDGPNPLSDRERQVLRMAREGLPVARIADALGLSTGTVRNRLSGAIQKTGTDNRVAAAAVATEHGWL